VGGFTADVRVRMFDGSTPTFIDLVNRFGARQAPGSGNIDTIRLLTVRSTERFGFSVGGSVRHGFVEVGMARLPRLEAGNVPVLSVEIEGDAPIPGGTVRCIPSQLWMLIDGSWRAARDLVKGDTLLPLATDQVPELAFATRGHTIQVVPRVKVRRVTTAGMADVFSLEVPSTGVFGLAVGALVSV